MAKVTRQNVPTYVLELTQEEAEFLVYVLRAAVAGGAAARVGDPIHKALQGAGAGVGPYKNNNKQILTAVVDKAYERPYAVIIDETEDTDW